MSPSDKIEKGLEFPILYGIYELYYLSEDGPLVTICCQKLIEMLTQGFLIQFPEKWGNLMLNVLQQMREYKLFQEYEGGTELERNLKIF